MVANNLPTELSTGQPLFDIDTEKLSEVLEMFVNTNLRNPRKREFEALMQECRAK